jgi:hypothetical protein
VFLCAPFFELSNLEVRSWIYREHPTRCECDDNKTELHTIEPFEHHSTFFDIVSTRHWNMPIGSVSNLLMKFGATEWLRSEASAQIRHE